MQKVILRLTNFISDLFMTRFVIFAVVYDNGSKVVLYLSTVLDKENFNFTSQNLGFFIFSL